MATYWISFRIRDATIDGKTYDERRNELLDHIDTLSSAKWDETTSFILFESDFSVDSIAALAAASIDETEDVALIRSLDKKEARLIGQADNPEVVRLIPYLK